MAQETTEPGCEGPSLSADIEPDSKAGCDDLPDSVEGKSDSERTLETPAVNRCVDIRRKRLLIVEDNLDVAQMLSEVLQIYGYITVVAHDGIAALELARSFRPDVALVDIGLPLMDGYQLARRFRQLPELRATRLFAVTGYGQLSDRLRSAEAGFDRHLVKPVDLEELRRLIEDVD